MALNGCTVKSLKPLRCKISPLFIGNIHGDRQTGINAAHSAPIGSWGNIGRPMGMEIARREAGRSRCSAGMLPLWECFPLSIAFFFPPHKALFKLRRATQSGHSSPRGQGTESQRHGLLYTHRPTKSRVQPLNSTFGKILLFL